MNIGEIEKILDHIENMPDKIGTIEVYWANSDVTYSTDTRGFILKLEEWRDELIELIVGKVTATAN